MSIVFKITPKRKHSVNRQIITPEMEIIVTTRHHCSNPFYGSCDDGATLCSSLIVEPLAFARGGIGNPGGTYRRTISRYDYDYGLKQLARFMAIKDDSTIYNVYEGKPMGCNKELFEQILASGNIQPATRDENGEWI